MNASLENPPEEVAASSSPATCTHCHADFHGRFFRANGAPFCGNCIAALQNSLTGPGSSAGRFIKAIILGSGATALSAIAYGLFMGLTGIEFALVTIAMGWFIGKSVRKGSGDRGGWRYGVLAVVLTYCAIAFSYFGMAVATELKGRGKPAQSIASPADLAKKGEPAAALEGNPAPVAPAEPAFTEEIQGVNPLLAVVVLLVTAFSAPIVVATQSILSALIIGFGLWEAWKINRGVPMPEITGPHEVPSPAV